MNLTRSNKYIALSLIFVGFLVANSSWAQIMPITEGSATSSALMVTDEPIILVDNSSTTNTIPTVKPRVGPRVTEEQKVTLTEIRQTRIINLAANISNRMDTAVMRLSNISQRLEQRILKIEEAGMKTSQARASLLAANENLANATLKLSDIDSLVNGATYSTEPRKDWQTVRERYQEAGSLIRQAHFALRESITFLKNPVLRDQITATSSIETNPNPEDLISN